MMQNPRDTYLAASVATASPAQLLVMLYDRLSLDLNRAVAALDTADHTTAWKAILHAQDIVIELRSTLKVDAWSGGPGLAALYDYLLTELIGANVRHDRVAAQACLALVEELRATWREAASSLATAAPLVASA
jgi:flagellar protein FliS